MTATGAAIRRAVEKNDPPDFPLFCLAAIALVVVQVGWAINIEGHNLRALRVAVAEIRPPFHWVDAPATFAIVFGLSVVGWMAVALLFSNQHAVRPRYAWIAFTVWGLAMTCTNLWAANAPVGGYADTVQAVWFDRDGPIARRPWSSADRVVIGCKKRPKVPKMRLRFDVQFDDRRAPLATRVGRSTIGSWLNSIRAIHQELPSSEKYIRSETNERCVDFFYYNIDKNDKHGLNLFSKIFRNNGGGRPPAVS